MNEQTPINDLQRLALENKNDQIPIEDQACAISKEDQSVNDNEEKSTQTDSYSEIKHLAYQDDEEKTFGSRCKLPKCRYFTHVFCKDCNKYFCLTRKRNCFAAYHLKNFK